MTITRLKLERFTAFEALDFEPSPGVNVLVGANGTGKTHLMKVAYAACDVSKTGAGFAEKIVRVFMPSGGAIRRLVKRRGTGASCDVRIHRGDRRLQLSFSTDTKAAGSATVAGASDWSVDPVESVYIPVEEMLANAPGLRSLQAQSEGIYADILDRAYSPALRGPMPRERIRLLTILQKAIDGKVHERNEEFPDYTQRSACALGSMETRAQAPRKPVIPCHSRDLSAVIPAKAGIHSNQELLDSRFRGNDGMKESIYPSFVCNQEEFFLRGRKTDLEFSLLAEGLCKIGLLWLLIQNGTLPEGSVLFWDEPEANLNPKLFGVVVEVLLELQRMGVQIFIATHDYAVLKEFDLQTKEKDKIVFHSLYCDGSEIACHTAATYLDLHPNAIAEAFDDLYDREVKRSLGDK